MAEENTAMQLRDKIADLAGAHRRRHNDARCEPRCSVDDTAIADEIVALLTAEQPKDALPVKTAHGAIVELHRHHFGPLLQAVREGKRTATREIGVRDVLREIEYRLLQASHAAWNTHG